MHALRPCMLELRGHRIALPAVTSAEPLIRGCDQREWLERLAVLGIRHLVVPLNGPEEDTCLYARRHPAPPAPERAGVVYDLARRDEGVFARLQFLLDAADQVGVLVGFSLFNPSLAQTPAPFARDANEQNVSWDDAWGGGVGQGRASRRSSTTAIRRRITLQSRVDQALGAAVDWMAAELRGRTAAWLQVFRGARRGGETAERLRLLEERLVRRLAEALARPGEDATKARLGPWVVGPPAFNWDGVRTTHRAPFGFCPCATPDVLTHVAYAADLPRQPLLCDFTAGARNSAADARGPGRGELWRSVMRGCWPIVPCGFSDAPSQRRWKDLAQLAVFCRQWAGNGYLRACPEMLATVPQGLVAGGKACAATDGCGRYFSYWCLALPQGLEVSLLPGTYRYYWFDPASGRGLDRGDGIEGSAQCRVPGPGRAREALLILEQEELPDPLSVW